MGQRRKSERICKLNDQPDWDICISWQRMLVAILSHDMDPTHGIKQFISETGEIAGVGVELMVGTWLRNAVQSLRAGDFYEACLDALEARARCEGDEGPERLNGRAGHALCACFRRVFPAAPPGFERIGRSGKT